MAYKSTGRFVWRLVSGKPVKENLVETACELSRTHSRLTRTILPIENGSHPPAAIFDCIGDKHGGVRAEKWGHELVGSPIGKNELTKDQIESTPLEEFSRLCFRGCKEDDTPSFEQVLLDDRGAFVRPFQQEEPSIR